MDSKELFGSITPRKVWTNKEIQTIITFVRSRPFLYNKKHHDYKHSQKKESAWEEISRIFKNKTARECKRKWNTLRIQQRRIIIQRMKKKGRQTQWHCFNLLQFLVPHMEWTSATNLDFEKKEMSDDDFEDHSIDFEDTKEQIIGDSLSVRPVQIDANCTSITAPTIGNEGNPIYIQDIHERCAHEDERHTAHHHNEDDDDEVESKQIPFDHHIQDVDHTTDDVVGAEESSRGVIQQNTPQELIQILHQSGVERDAAETTVVASEAQYYLTSGESITQGVECSNTSPQHTSNVSDTRVRIGVGIGSGSRTRLSQSTSICSADMQFGTIDSNAAAGGSSAANLILGTSPHSVGHANDPTSSSSATGHAVTQAMSSLALNYFLMDIQIQMDKLNDIAQMELKIEIQKLLLNKLRNPECYPSPYQRSD